MSVELVFGGATFSFGEAVPLEEVRQTLDLIEEAGVKVIDTATIYQDSEEILGKVKAASRFRIDTKYPGGFSPVPFSKESILAIADASLTKLQTDQIGIYYLHAPDRNSSLEEQLEAINSLHQAGKFRGFGLSNFLAEEVEEVVRIAKEKNYILPTVYQGNYNAVARHSEAQLLPTLRRHNIAYYAYSPIAGGFLAKTVEELLAGGQGRWDPTSRIGGIYHLLYNRPAILEGLRLWEKISTESGIPKAELAYRWVRYHSALKAELGDTVVFGPRNNEQLKETLAGFKRGPLSADVVKQIEGVWKTVEAEAPLDNLNGLLALKSPEELEEMKKKG